MTDHTESATSRRRFITGSLAAAGLVAAGPRNALAEFVSTRPARGGAYRTVALDHGWTFGEPGDAASTLKHVDVPHCVTNLSWQDWDTAKWQKDWQYKNEFRLAGGSKGGQRAFIHFEGVMSGATVTMNGKAFEKHLGGYLPFEYEVTDCLQEDNNLSVVVDGRWLNVPPSGSPKGPQQVDYLLPAGIHRSVSLRVVPDTFIADVFARQHNVLQTGRTLEVECTLDARAATGDHKLVATLFDGATVVARESIAASWVPQTTQNKNTITLNKLSSVKLWSPDSPKLYTLRVALMNGENTVHEYSTRIGFREAKFEVDGFFLNGKKTTIFGLNRHELFPYVGYAMPRRVMRKDAAILKHDYNVNTVRCSHYPQTEAFLDACDEMGIMAWEEIPGWQYIGDDAWKQLLLRDVRTMILRDRNRPSIIIWGTRVNESHNDPELYTKTRAIAKELDGTRADSGTMTKISKDGWAQDVYTFDDYHAGPDGNVAMHDPLPGVPFLFGEGVGQYQYRHGKGFQQYYRRAGNREWFSQQGLFHAQGHDRARRDPRCAGLIAWCAYDYASMTNGYHAVKCPGVTDTFRIPKLAAMFYRSQCAPQKRVVLEPSFYWDYRPGAEGNPGKECVIFSNCDRIVMRVGTTAPVTLHPDKEGFPHLAYPPFITDLSTIDMAAHPDLTLEGYVGNRLALTRRFSSDRSKDQLIAHADDVSIVNDGSDATRVWFSAADKYGSLCAVLDGEASVRLEGPAVMVGDRTFKFAETGGVGAVWVKAKRGAGGIATVHIAHPKLGARTVTVRITPATA